MKRNWTENALAFASFFMSLVVYIKTLAPGVTFTDSGELAVDCITLGVAHPTGYPLFTILGHIWSLLPIPGSPIYKLNVFAAVCTSLSVLVFYKTALLILRRINAQVQVGGSVRRNPNRRKDRKRLQNTAQETIEVRPAAGIAAKDVPDNVLLVIAFGAALAYGFGRTIWQQATAIEVYSLHLLLVLTFLWSFLRAVWADTPRTRDFLLWAFVLGLALANHLTTVWLGPAVLFLFFKRQGFRKRTGVLLLKMVAPFALGLSFYLYLPLRSTGYFPFHAPPHFDWGGVGRGWPAFVYHVTAHGFSDRLFDGSWPKQLKVFYTDFPYQVAFIGLIPLVIGLWRLMRRGREILLFLILLIGTCVGFAVNYDIFDIDSYFALAIIGSVFLMAIGFLPLAKSRAPLAFTALLIPLIALGLNYRENDRSQEHLVQDYTHNMVDNLEPNAIIISSQWDYFVSAFWYLQTVEGYRPDVIVIDSGLIKDSWYLNELRRCKPDLMSPSATEARDYQEDLERFEFGKNYDGNRLQARYVAFMNSLIKNNISTRPIYFTGEPDNIDPGIGAGYVAPPAGLAYRWIADPKTTRAWNTDFNFSRFLTFPADPTDHLQRGIYETAAVGVANSARFQAGMGRQGYSDQIMDLSKQLSAKVKDKQ